MSTCPQRPVASKRLTCRVGVSIAVGAGEASGPVEFLDEAVLEGSEGALGAAACLSSGEAAIGSDVLDAELMEGAADLGALVLGDFAAGLRRVEVVAGAVGIEAAGQALGAEHLLERAEGGRGAFLLDQEGRVDLAGGVVHGDDEVERGLAGEPFMA